MHARIGVLLLAVSAGLPLRPAAAAGFVSVRAAAGARSQMVESVDAAYATASGTVAGIGGTSYSEDRVDDIVSGVRANVSTRIDHDSYGLRGYLYPRRFGSRAYGGTVFTQQRAGDSGEDYEGLWGLSGSWIRHDLSTLPGFTPQTQSFGEGVLEFMSRQTYYQEFHFQLAAAYFYYDRNLSSIRHFRTPFVQTDVANLGTLAVVNEPPRWDVGIQYSRSIDDQRGKNVVFGYSRIGLLSGSRYLNSYLVAVQAALMRALQGEIGYNGVEGTASSYSSYFGGSLTYYLP
jgi:hypothetical protein